MARVSRLVFGCGVWVDVLVVLVFEGNSFMKFDMGSQTLATLNQKTSGSNDDLGGLVRQLVAAVAPLEGKFNGQGRVRFDQFKARADEIAADLNSSLARIAQGQSEMNVATQTGDQQTADNSTRNESAANFDGARFSSTR